MPPLLRLPSVDVVGGLLLLSWAEFGEVSFSRLRLGVSHSPTVELGKWLMEFRWACYQNGIRPWFAHGMS